MQKYLYKDLYDLEDLHWWHKSKRRNILSLLQKFIANKNPKILDVGCGTGKNIEVFSEIGEVWGIDNAREAIEFCKKRGLKSVRLGSAESTGFPPKCFDLITLLDVLEHTNDKAALKEIYRLLRPGGFLIITVPAFPMLWSQWDEVLQHKRRYTKGSLKKILKQNSFEIVKISYMFSFLFIPVYIIRLVKSKITSQNYRSDFRINTPLLNFLLYKISGIENYLMQYFNLPFGTSLICLARKKA